MADLREDSDSDDQSEEPPKKIKAIANREIVISSLNFIPGTKQLMISPLKYDPKIPHTLNKTILTDWLSAIVLNEASEFSTLAVSGDFHSSNQEPLVEWFKQRPHSHVPTVPEGADTSSFLSEIYWSQDAAFLGRFSEHNKPYVCVLLEDSKYLGHVYFGMKFVPSSNGWDLQMIGIRSSLLAIATQNKGIATGLLCGLLKYAKEYTYTKDGHVTKCTSIQAMSPQGTMGNILVRLGADAMQGYGLKLDTISKNLKHCDAIYRHTNLDVPTTITKSTSMFQQRQEHKVNSGTQKDSPQRKPDAQPRRARRNKKRSSGTELSEVLEHARVLYAALSRKCV